MRIRVVNTAFSKGGASRVAVFLTKAIERVDKTIHIEYLHSEICKSDSLAVKFKKTLSRYLNALLYRFLADNLFLDFGFSKVGILQSKDTDLVHLHNLHGYYIDYKKLIKNIGDKPIIWTWHDMWGATGRCAQALSCTKWKNGCGACPNKNFYPASWLDWSKKDYKSKSELFLSKKNLVIVTPSQWLADIAITRGFSLHRIKIIPNPVDIDSFKVIPTKIVRKTLGLVENNKYCLFVAADCNNYQKGYNDFLELINITGYSGLVVGKPPMIKSNKILYTGTLINKEMLCNFYCAADVLLVPTKADNYPNTVIESFACGTPVIAYDEGGIPSQMPQFWNGITHKNDVNAMVSMVTSYYSTGGKSDELSMKFRQYAEITWHPNTVAEQYIAIYKELISDYS